MKTKRDRPKEDGSVLVVAIVFLSIAGFSIGSIMSGTSNFLRMNRVMHNHERAFLLADAGLAAALVDLNNGGDGIITRSDSRNYFSRTNHFTEAGWGFETSTSDLSGGALRISSEGTCRDSTAQCQVNASEDVGEDTIHCLYSMAVYAGNSSNSTNYLFDLGGSGSRADFVHGDIHCNGDIEILGDATVRLPEEYTDSNNNGVWDPGEEWIEAGVAGAFTNDPTAAAYNDYVASVSNNTTYGNGRYDQGEAFIDNYGNGVYDPGEPYNDLDGDGVFSFGDTFTDLDGDGEYDEGDQFVDTGNGEYDQGEEFQDLNGNGVWDDATEGHYEGSGWGRVWVDGEPAEPFEDQGNGEYDEGEQFVDRNGVFDPNTSDVFYDDRNGYYDYGISAPGQISGAPSPGVGQISAISGSSIIDPPDLDAMHYDVPRTDPKPSGASKNWGNHVDVANAGFAGNGKIMDQNNPAHIFVKNRSGVSYEKIDGKDDYFLEDPTDPSYGSGSQYITVTPDGNDKVYYVDGNVYLHNPNAYDFMFRNPGTRITIVAKGNIHISDEFWYNGGTEAPQDMMALIALDDPDVENSGNIYFGDPQFGTGGDVHAMLYAENDFKDNNLNTAGQTHLSVFGNMTAGDHVLINREGANRTRLGVMMDNRIITGEDLPPGLPPALTGQRTIYIAEGWYPVPGTWSVHSRLYSE